jgi:hypothetical protein
MCIHVCRYLFDFYRNLQLFNWVIILEIPKLIRVLELEYCRIFRIHIEIYFMHNV